MRFSFCFYYYFCRKISNHEKDSIFISNLYADMPGCIGSNLKEAEPNAERFHRYYAQSNR